MKDYPEIYAVDFDGTLNLADHYPELGKPNRELIKFLREKQRQGDKIILWTCREGELLEVAVLFCKENGLIFDAVNDNTEENKTYWGNNCRKVTAHYYIDDRNLFRPEMEGKMKESTKRLKCSVCGKEFKPKKEDRYTGVIVRMVGPNDYHDCFDCPECGSQIMVNRRIEKAEE